MRYLIVLLASFLSLQVFVASASHHIKYILLAEEAKHQENIDKLLLKAVNDGDTDSITYLLKKGADINQVNWLGRPLVYSIARNGNTGMVEYLLNQGADPLADYLFYDSLLDYVSSAFNISVDMKVFVHNYFEVNNL